MPERSRDGCERLASPLDTLSRQRLSAFACFYLPGNPATEQDRAGRVVGVDDVEHGVDDAMRGTPPLEFCHRATVTRGYDTRGVNSTLGSPVLVDCSVVGVLDLRRVPMTDIEALLSTKIRFALCVS